MINFSRLLDWRFWFAMKPSPLSERTVIIIAAVFIILIITSLVFRVMVRVKKQSPPLAKVFKKIYKMLSTMAFVGFVLLFLAYEQIYFLGARFWFLLWFLGLIVWFVFVLLHLLKRMPKEKETLEQKKRFEKYLPR